MICHRIFKQKSYYLTKPLEHYQVIHIAEVLIEKSSKKETLVED